MKTSISYISRNPISLVGLALAVASITVFVVLAIIGLFIEGGGPYLGILTFVVVPSLLVIGSAAGTAPPRSGTSQRRRPFPSSTSTARESVRSFSPSPA